jgi:hypothetical protein
MNGDFEYMTYLDDMRPGTSENDDARVRGARARRAGTARAGTAPHAGGNTAAWQVRGYPRAPLADMRLTGTGMTETGPAGTAHMATGFPSGGFPGAAIPPDGFGDADLADEDLADEEEPEEQAPEDELAEEGHEDWHSAAAWADSGARTEVLITRGRSSAGKRRLSAPRMPGWLTGRRWLTRRNILVAAGLALVLAVALAVILPGDGASWPASVATVKQQADAACQNPNVASEPGQVNFACAADSRRILWVFALLTSGDNPSFADSGTGRRGLEPITPAQGGAVAFSLNLHHPYDPANPVDSLAVAARAINSIIGGATVTTQSGGLVVQPGLESSAGNCERYTGSGALITREGFPALCAKPVTSTAGQAALVADVYRQWMVGAPAQQAGNAAVLYANPGNPGDPRVQAILHDISQAR